MDDKSVHSKYLKDVNKFVELIKITPLLLQLLETHTFGKLMPAIKTMTSDEAQKYAILTQFTLSTDGCNKLIDYLNQDNQTDLANMLREYNQTPKSDTYSNDIKLDIKSADELRSGHSRWYVMDGSPRGRVLLFQQFPSVDKEAKRFEIMFQELYFKVDIMTGLNGQAIRDKCHEVANNQFSGDALIVMYIGHGQDEMISPSAPETPDQTAVADLSDDIHIKQLIDIFAENKSHPSLRNKPKIFVFNCCRISMPTQPPVPTTPIENDWMDNTTRTYICYSSAEGITAFYYPDGFTIFGQVFSHTIANHAYEMSLEKLFNKVNNDISKIGSNGNELGEKQRPKLTIKHLLREIYLNPGLFNPDKP